MRGGARKGAGRKARPTLKAKGIWCGQISDEQRNFIMQWLSPEDRYSVLMAAANKASTRPPKRTHYELVQELDRAAKEVIEKYGGG